MTDDIVDPTVDLRFSPGRPGSYARGVVQVEIRAGVYHALGPIAAHQGKAITAFINAVLEELVARKRPRIGGDP